MNTCICTYIYTHNLFTHFMCKMKAIVVSHLRHWSACSCLFLILVGLIVPSQSKKIWEIPEEPLVLNQKWVSRTAGSHFSEGNSSSSRNRWSSYSAKGKKQAGMTAKHKGWSIPSAVLFTYELLSKASPDPCGGSY